MIIKFNFSPCLYAFSIICMLMNPNESALYDKNECQRRNVTCQQACNIDGNLTSCNCLNGYVIDEVTNTTCVDVDECSRNSCYYKCVNIGGSYDCVCPFGQIHQQNMLSVGCKLVLPMYNTSITNICLITGWFKPCQTLTSFNISNFINTAFDSDTVYYELVQYYFPNTQHPLSDFYYCRDPTIMVPYSKYECSLLGINALFLATNKRSFVCSAEVPLYQDNCYTLTYVYSTIFNSTIGNSLINSNLSNAQEFEFNKYNYNYICIRSTFSYKNYNQLLLNIINSTLTSNSSNVNYSALQASKKQLINCTEINYNNFSNEVMKIIDYYFNNYIHICKSTDVSLEIDCYRISNLNFTSLYSFLSLKTNKNNSQANSMNLPTDMDRDLYLFELGKLTDTQNILASSICLSYKNSIEDKCSYQDVNRIFDHLNSFIVASNNTQIESFSCYDNCQCLDNYYLSADGNTCLLIPRSCTFGNPVCKPSCYNSNDNLICYCPNGYNKDGNLCVVDNCLTANCDQFCSSSIFNYTCFCSEGLQSIYNKCIDINECIDTNNPVCNDNKVCVNLYGSYDCLDENLQLFNINLLLDECKDITNVVRNLGTYTITNQFPTSFGVFNQATFCPNGKVVFGPKKTCSPIISKGESIEYNVFDEYLMDLSIDNVDSGFKFCSTKKSILSTILNNTGYLSEDVYNWLSSIYDDKSDLLVFLWKNVGSIRAIKERHYFKPISIATIIKHDELSTNLLNFYGNDLNQLIDFSFYSKNTGYLIDLNANKIKKATINKEICSNCYHSVNLGSLPANLQQYKCIYWAKSQLIYNNPNIIDKNSLDSCPFSLNHALNDFTYKVLSTGTYKSLDNITNITCFFKWINFNQNNDLTLQCCYEASLYGKFIKPSKDKNPYKSVAYLTAKTSNQSFEYWELLNNVRLDMNKKCCSLGESQYCQIVFDAQIQLNNFNYVRPSYGLLYGSGHFVTADGNSFQFNGIGDHILIRSKSSWNGISFRVDVRLEQALHPKIANVLLNTTVATAIGVSINASSILEVYINQNASVNPQLVIYNRLYNWDKFTRLRIGDQSILKLDNKKLLILNDEGNGILISTVSQWLVATIITSETFFGQNEGLLGNVDANSSNDYISKNGQLISSDSLDVTIYNDFAKSWYVKESLLKFNLYVNSFVWVPNFLSAFTAQSLNQGLLNDALVLCLNIQNNGCIFDYTQTLNPKVLEESMNTLEQFNLQKAALNTVPPLILSVNTIEGSFENIKLDEKITGKVNLKITNLSIIYSSNYHLEFFSNGQFIWKLYEETSIMEPLKIVATDSNDQVATISIPLKICSCLNSQSCDTNSLALNKSLFSDVLYYICQCSIEYSGDMCQIKVDPCQNSNCFNASSCSVSNGEISCGACPDGYAGDGVVCLLSDRCLINNILCSLQIDSKGVIGVSVSMAIFGISVLFIAIVLVFRFF